MVGTMGMDGCAERWNAWLDLNQSPRTTQPPVDPFDLATTYPKRTEITAHRNGITKPKGNKYASMKGVDPKVRCAMRRAPDL